ncbi:flagellar hook-associated protein FlgK [Sphingosinithalassobacter sp. LHW66-3]|uniref:flagellar hook-associated protein FlgK n=1 Tax=Sphingosinithalassobacter sp. LHW66-3 TaxID=3424718 RepID=UPI003D6A0644
MSDMLGIGASGVRAYQSALNTTSENIANAGTAGYVRRTTQVREIASPSFADARLNGSGVAIDGVVRSGDAIRSAEVRNAGADLARSEASVTWLARIEGALTGNQLGERLTAFFNSAKAVAADPAAVAPRAAMLESAAALASAFSATGAALAGAAADLDTSADAAVDALNNLATSLAKVNGGIGRTMPGTSGHAAMLDERDRLLEAMSALTDIHVSVDSAGRAAVRAGGAAGPVLIDGTSAGIVTCVGNGEGALSFAVHRSGEIQTLVPAAGALAGTAEGAQRIAAARAELDLLATAFIDGANAVQASGQDLDGQEGMPLFTPGETPAQITVALHDPRGIAAALPGGGTRDNGNLAGFEALRSDAGFENRVTTLITSNASALSSRRSVAEAQATMRDNAVAVRDAGAAVNLDEEAVDLIRFQQAFQASGRVIQVARETLQAILDIR